MSHYIYRKKLFAETANGLILPFACYSDSSITAGHGRYTHHPSSWCVMNLGYKHLFPSRKVGEDSAKAEYELQIDLLQQYERRYPTGKPIGPDSYHYGGNTYPGGGKLRNMRSFYSVRNAIPLGDFLQQHRGVSISLEPIKPASFESYEKKEIHLTAEDSAAAAEKEYQALLEKYPDARGICVGVYGLY